MTYDTVVIGGGPGGSTVGILLARAGLTVAVIEKDRLPRHKLCGEFLSGEGVAVLDALGLEHHLIGAGATPIETVAVTTDTAAYHGPVPRGAMSISRWCLDKILLDAAVLGGVDVYTEDAVRSVEGCIREGFTVSTDHRQIQGRTVVCAAGRGGRIIDRIRHTRPASRKRRSVAFKRHYVGQMTAGRVELHTYAGGYCGLQQVENGMVNACWITDAAVLREAGGKPEGMIEQTFRENRHLSRRMQTMERPEAEFLAVSQLDFAPKGPVANEILMIGDSAGMIAPLCGDGIAMALHSATMAATLIEAYLSRHLEPGDMLARYATEWKRVFLARMWLGRTLQSAMERRVWCSAGIQACRTFPSLGRWLTTKTRGGKVSPKLNLK